MTPLPPWTSGPFELLLHAEEHLRAGEDFDRRIALISFDNAIEVAIVVYLSLNPMQRKNRQYKRADVDNWFTNYHTRLDFIEFEVLSRKSKWEVDREHIVWCHDHRNQQYHGAHRGVPDRQVLDIARRAALWIFSMLFEVEEIEQRIEAALLAKLPRAPARNPTFDAAIDIVLDTIPIGDQVYPASEVLYSVDYEAYRDLGMQLSDDSPNAGPLH
jgi:hypothetical protein